MDKLYTKIKKVKNIKSSVGFFVFQQPMQNATVNAKHTFIATSPTTLVTQSVKSFFMPF